MSFKRILDGLSNAFESISDRLRNAPEIRLWQRILQMRWPGPPTVTQGRRKEKKKKERSKSCVSSHWRPSPLPRLCVERKYFKLFHLNYFHRTKAQEAKARRSGAQLKKHKGSKSDAQWYP